MLLLGISSTSLFSPLLPNSSKLPCLTSSFNGLKFKYNFSIQTPSNFANSLVVKMAKREEELKEIRQKTTEEINEEIIDLKGELFMLRLQRSARNDFKPSEFGRMRKRVARMLTVRREREIEEGIGRRLSRKLDKKWRKSIEIRPPPSLRKKQEEEKAKAAEAENSV